MRRTGFCGAPQKFEPLVEKCKRLNRAMRVGTNHGSLSARILSYYGDTPRGMVESAFEFADMCRDLDYHNFLFSMKASNPLVMVQVPAPAHSLSGLRHHWCLLSLVACRVPTSHRLPLTDTMHAEQCCAASHSAHRACWVGAGV